MSKILIAYFSRADENYFGGKMSYIKVGNTEVAANLIKDYIEADIFKIEMKVPYSKEYSTCIDEAKKDYQNNARPELVSLPDSVDEYDTLILAYPNYWGTMPMAVLTFLDSFDFSKKMVLPLCTHEGSGMGASEADVKKYTGSSNVKKGLAVRGSNVASSGADIKKWLEVNGII